MNQQDFNPRSAVNRTSYAATSNEKETLVEKFIYWFREFLDNAE